MGDRAWCVRRWPDGFAADRLRWIHRALRCSRDQGFTGVPDLATLEGEATILDGGGALYDAQQWLPGEPVGGRPAWAGTVANTVRSLPPGQLAALATVLAEFHRSTDALAPSAGATVRPLLDQLAETAVDLPARCAALAARAGDPLDAAGRAERAMALRWLALLPRAMMLTERVLRGHPESARAATTVCHGDLWPQHVYAVGDRFSGFVDFEHLAFGSPAGDLAQLILHFGGWGARAAVVRAYATRRALGAGERAVLPAAAVLDLVGEALWSLGLLYGDGPPASPAAHRHNLRALLPSLELLVTEMGGAG